MKNKITTAAIFLCGIGAIALIFTIIAFTAYNQFYWLGETRTADWGQFGDFFGGVFGTIISFATLYYVYVGFQEQRRESEHRELQYIEEKKEVEIQAKKNEIEKRFFLMLELYKKNVAELETETDITKVGKQVIDKIIEDFEDIYDNVRLYRNRENDTSITDISEDISFSYEILYFGYPNITDIWISGLSVFEIYLNEPDEDFLNRLRNSAFERDKFIAFLYANFGIPPNSPKTQYELWQESGINTKGFHNQLGHYFRHLYNMVNYINKQAILNDDEKYEYIKVLRTQLTNSEQLLIFLNSFFVYGQAWEFKHRKFHELKKDMPKEQQAQLLITPYSLIKNIPDGKIFGSIEAKDFFPDVKFESLTFRK